MSLLRLFFIILSILMTSGCSHPPEIVTISGVEMTIPFRILIPGPLSPEKQLLVKSTIYNEFRTIDNTFNNWNPASQISQINQANKEVWIPLSSEVEQLLTLCARYTSLTDGRFDPTIAPLWRVWKKALETNSLPNHEGLTKAEHASGWSHFEISNHSIRKDNTESCIDLGAVAKGYCVDCIIDALKKLNFSEAYVEWGGEIRVLGKHPLGRPWTIYISNFEDTNPENALDYIELENQAIATSGDYLQQWTLHSEISDSKTYSHIIDPKTKTPINASDSKQSATVISPTCVEADILATAFLATPREERNHLLSRLKNSPLQFEVFLYDERK